MDLQDLLFIIDRVINIHVMLISAIKRITPGRATVAAGVVSDGDYGNFNVYVFR